MKADDSEEWLEAPAYRLRLRDDGVLEAQARPDSVSTPESAQASLSIMRKLVGEAAPVPMLVDMRGLKNTEPAVGRFVASDAVAPLIARLALVVGSPVSQVLATALVGLYRPPMPTRLFDDEQAALDWLMQDQDAPE